MPATRVPPRRLGREQKAADMTLLEVCDPLFKYVCFLNRSARKGADLDSAQVESEVDAIFSTMRSTARSNPGLGDQYEKIELPLMYFVDNIICTGTFPLAQNWNRIAYRREVYTGDDEFGVDLEKALSEPESVSANERLAVFYTCLGLGFAGGNYEDPTLRQQRMAQLARRIRSIMELEDRARITPQAYQYTLQDDLVPPPVGPVWKIGVALVGLVAVLIAVNAYAYLDDLRQLRDHLSQITHQSVSQQQQQEGQQ
jgi:type VI protein secretion system component VasF